MKNLPDSSIVSLCQSENRQYADIVTSDTVKDVCIKRYHYFNGTSAAVADSKL